jgi:hypothetical protein
MAYQKLGSPVDYMNMKQLRFRAQNLGLAFDLSTTAASLITAIKAA